MITLLLTLLHKYPVVVLRLGVGQLGPGPEDLACFGLGLRASVLRLDRGEG